MSDKPASWAQEVKDVPAQTIDTLLKRVQKGECWEVVSGYRDRHGYACVYIGRRRILAHRVMYAHEFGLVPSGKMVCHRCDNPSCVKPDHLFLGDARINLTDSIRKNRTDLFERHGMRGELRKCQHEIKLLWAEIEKLRGKDG